MTYNISSNQLQHPLLKPILNALVSYFSKSGIQFYVIGATARDIIMQLHDEKSGRATQDLDIAIAVEDWDRYQEVEKGILEIDGFSKDQKQQQRFLYLDTFPLDIVPFGNVMQQDDKIFWPPDEHIAMSVLGFNEVALATQHIKVDDDFSIEIASLVGIFLLKLVAWSERHANGNKDADDIGFILNNYLSINQDRALEQHTSLYADDEFDTRTAGARLLGRDLAELLKESVKVKQKIVIRLETEVKLAEESQLINQIIETHTSFKYEDAFRILTYLLKGLID